MKPAAILIRFAIIVVLLAALAAHAAADPLRQVFLDAPDEAKPRGYWVWPHGNFDYATLRHELAEFKARGLGGVDIFDLGVRDPKKVIPPGAGFLSSEQVDGIAFALPEGQRKTQTNPTGPAPANAGATRSPSPPVCRGQCGYGFPRKCGSRDNRDEDMKTGRGRLHQIQRTG